MRFFPRPSPPCGAQSQKTTTRHAARKRLQAERAASGKKIEHTSAVKISAEHGKHGLARARSCVGLVPSPGGASIRLPPTLPAMMRMSVTCL